MKKHIDNPIMQAAAFVGVCSIVTVIWITTPTRLGSDLKDLSERGAYGDSFGAVNALFTGLAFAGVIFALLLQQRALALQREELKAQLDEMKESRNEFIQQNKLIKAQIDVHLLDIRTKAKELEAHYHDMEAKQFVPGSSNYTAHSEAVKKCGNSILNMVGQLQAKKLPAEFKEEG